MDYMNDYMMRQIQGASAMLARILLGKDVNPIEMFDEEGEMSSEGLLYQRLKKLVSEGRIGKAEDLLFDELSACTTLPYLKVARMFYDDLNQLSDETLRAGGFSRAEILEGMNDVQRMFGIPSSPDEE